MKQSFTYGANASIKDYLTELIIGIALIVGPIVYPFGIKIGATRILSPKVTMILFIVIGIVLLLRMFINYRQARLLAAHNGQVVVEDDKITYPIVKKGIVSEGSFVKADIAELNCDHEDGILTINLKNGETIEFYSDDFENSNHFREFEELLRR